MLAEQESGALAAALAELKAYLRMEQDGEDAVLAGLLRGAAALCEQFVGQWLIARDARETVAGDALRRSSTSIMAMEDVSKLPLPAADAEVAEQAH